jgi:hypothetical protein
MSNLVVFYVVFLICVRGFRLYPCSSVPQRTWEFRLYPCSSVPQRTWGFRLYPVPLYHKEHEDLDCTPVPLYHKEHSCLALHENPSINVVTNWNKYNGYDFSICKNKCARLVGLTCVLYQDLQIRNVHPPLDTKITSVYTNSIFEFLMDNIFLMFGGLFFNR